MGAGRESRHGLYKLLTARPVPRTAAPGCFLMTPFFFRLLAILVLTWSPVAFAAEAPPAYPELVDGRVQYAGFPKPDETYPPADGSVLETLKARAMADPFNIAASAIFLLAIIHTFAAGAFTRLSHRIEQEHLETLKHRETRGPAPPAGVMEVSFLATIFHFLGEVEAVFGIWVIALAGAAAWFHSWEDFVLYLSKDRNFTEPLFVFVIMAVAASRPVLRFSEALMAKVASLGKGSPSAWWLSVLIVAPVLGSFITEPAAMTTTTNSGSV